MEILKAEANDKRPRQIGNNWVGLVIHHTDIGGRDPDTVDDRTWMSLFKNITNYLAKKDDNYVSAHYHVGRMGECVELVDPTTHVAYHAGKSEFWHPVKRKVVQGWNDYAIGIELLGDGNLGVYSDAQYSTLIELCRNLIATFPTINPLCIVGHEMIAPGRKQDPGKFFDWERLYKGIYK